MVHIGAAEVRIHFGKLLRRAENGESVAITRHGRHVATLIPASHLAAVPASETVEGAFERLESIRRKIVAEGRGLSSADIPALRDEGRS